MSEPRRTTHHEGEALHAERAPGPGRFKRIVRNSVVLCVAVGLMVAFPWLLVAYIIVWILAWTFKDPK